MFLLVVSKGVVRRPEGAALREAQRRSEAEPPSLPSFHEKAGGGEADVRVGRRVWKKGKGARSAFCGR